MKCGKYMNFWFSGLCVHFGPSVYRFIFPLIRLVLGESNGKLPWYWGKQWQTTPKNLARMQRNRAIPVAWLSSGLCPDRPKGWIPIIIIIIIIIRVVFRLYLGRQGCPENVEGNAEFCKVLLSHRRDADCGVPLHSAHGLGAGKMGEAVKKQYGKLAN